MGYRGEEKEIEINRHRYSRHLYENESPNLELKWLEIIVLYGTCLPLARIPDDDDNDDLQKLK